MASWAQGGPGMAQPPPSRHNVQYVQDNQDYGFLKLGANPQKKTTRDGQPPKRRGPKPDSKPAQTRRQELNRQAQRTHRERKEQYMRSLETELTRLRECYTNDINSANKAIHQHREALQDAREENQALKEILAIHGIPFEAELQRRKAALHNSNAVPVSTPSPGYTGAQSFLTPPSTVAARSPPGTEQEVQLPPGTMPPGVSYMQTPVSKPSHQTVLDESSPWVGVGAVVPDAPKGVFEQDSQLETDFILGIERTCNSHLEFLCRSAHDNEAQDMFSGHALMATCPPPVEIESTEPGHICPHQPYDLPAPNLNTLLNLSPQFVKDREMTPIMALQYLKNHEMYSLFTPEDIRTIMGDLSNRVRCYGFGAVMEDFELTDAINAVLENKVAAYAIAPGSASGGPVLPSASRAEDMMYA